MMILKNKRLFIILLAIMALLMIPFIAMQFTNEVNWTLSDFVVAGVLLLTTGLIAELIMRKIKKINYRILLLFVLIIILLLIWAELAVGVFGTPFSGS